MWNSKSKELHTFFFFRLTNTAVLCNNKKHHASDMCTNYNMTWWMMSYVSAPAKNTLRIFLHSNKEPHATPIHPADSACPIPNFHFLPMESSGHPHSGLDCKGFGVPLPCILLISYSKIIEVTFPFLLCLWPTVLCTMLLLLFFFHLTLSKIVYNQYDADCFCVILRTPDTERKCS